VYNISHLNTERDGILLAVHVTFWVVYVCAFVGIPWLAFECFLKTDGTRIFPQTMMYVLDCCKLIQHEIWKDLHCFASIRKI